MVGHNSKRFCSELKIRDNVLVGIRGDERDVRVVIVPAGMHTIGGYVFCDCSGLTSLTLPDTLTDIGGYAFCDCDTDVSTWTLDGDSWMSGKQKSGTPRLTGRVITKKFP